MNDNHRSDANDVPSDDAAARDAYASVPSSLPGDGRLRMLVDSITDYALLMLDPGGRVQTCNAGVERIGGYTAGEIIGRHFSLFYPEEAQEAAARHLGVAREQGRVEDEGWRVRKDGSRFWARVIITTIRGSRGERLGFATVTSDITAREQAARRLRESEERFRLLVERVTDYAIFMLDPTGRVTTWNVGAERIKGYAAGEIVGRHFSVFYPPDVVASGWPKQELAIARAEGHFEDQGWRIRKDGSRFWANVVITALRDERGALRGFSKVTRDLTELRAAEERLREAHAQLEQRVQQRTAELAEANAALTAEIAERHRLETELRLRVEELHAADRSKDEFLATLAHELRNPLAPILTAVHFLSLEGPPDPRLRRARDIIHRQVRQMTRLIEDLLDVSRITRNTLQLRLEHIDLAAVVQSAIETSRPFISAHQHELAVTLPQESIPLHVDPTRLAQVFSNLLNNAAKFTEPGGRIELWAQRAGDTVSVRVRDTGIGIPAEALPHVFDMFAQIHRGDDRTQSGLGIGLTLVKRLVEMHGGTVEARSEGPGRGSEFIVTLAAASAAAESAPHDEQTGVPRLTGQRVLIADDNDDSVTSLGLLLSSLGADVRLAHDGEEAVALAAQFSPHAVLLDLGMPRVDGFHAARQIRRLPGGTRMLLIATSGWGQPQDRDRAAQAGFDRHLTKPIDLDALREILNAQTR